MYYIYMTHKDFREEFMMVTDIHGSYLVYIKIKHVKNLIKLISCHSEVKS